MGLVNNIANLINNKNMKIIDSKKVYKAPEAEVVEVNIQSMLCQSGTYGNTEGFTHSHRSYDDWE